MIFNINNLGRQGDNPRIMPVILWFVTLCTAITQLATVGVN